MGALAVGALVVVELDDGDVARRIAAGGAVGVAEQLSLVLADRLPGHGIALGVLLALELLHGLDQDLGIGHQVSPDALAEIGRHGGIGIGGRILGRGCDPRQAGAGRGDGTDNDQAGDCSH